MEEKPGRRITVTSSLNEISTVQKASGEKFKDDVNCFSSSSDMCFMPWRPVSEE
jgi:hypothetical protein